MPPGLRQRDTHNSQSEPVIFAAGIFSFLPTFLDPQAAASFQYRER
jgi:hypothetical protein